MNLGKVEIWETSLDRIVTLREAQGRLAPSFQSLSFLVLSAMTEFGILYELVTGLEPWKPWEKALTGAVSVIGHSLPTPCCEKWSRRRPERAAAEGHTDPPRK